jgi:phage baseplate assembly protein W
VVQDSITQAIAQWEPRVRLDGVQATVNAVDPRDVDVVITYTLVATSAQERLAMTVSPVG